MTARQAASPGSTATSPSSATAKRAQGARAQGGKGSPSQPKAPVKPKSSRTGRSSSARPRTRVIAVANQKGGVGKSTTAVSLGAALAELGRQVLVVDLDPQGNASTGLGIGHHARDVTVYEVLAAEAPIEGAIVETQVAGLFAIPSTIDLAGAEIELVSQFSRELRLRKALEPLRDGTYDFILLDCPPSLGLLTVNALAAAEELIVPIQCEYYALEGLGQLLRNVGLVQQNVNPGLRLSGIVMTMFDPRTKLSEQVVDEVRKFFGKRVYDVIIPRTVRLSEAPGFGQPITVYDSKSRGAESYRQLAREITKKPIPESEPMPVVEGLPARVEAAAVALVPLIPESVAGPEPMVKPEETAEIPVTGDGLARPVGPEPQVELDVAPPLPEPVPLPSEPPSGPEGALESMEAEEETLEGEDEFVQGEVGVEATAQPSPRVIVVDEGAEIRGRVQAVVEPEGVPSGVRMERRAPTRTSSAAGGLPVAGTPPEPALPDTLPVEQGRKRWWRVFRRGGGG